jgi:hypothetical protein
LLSLKRLNASLAWRTVPEQVLGKLPLPPALAAIRRGARRAGAQWRKPSAARMLL